MQSSKSVVEFADHDFESIPCDCCHCSGEDDMYLAACESCASYEELDTELWCYCAEFVEGGRNYEACA